MSYFKDPLLAKWASECFQVKDLGAKFSIEADPMSVLLMLDCISARPTVSGDADRLRAMIRAELSAAQEMREVLRENQWSSEHHHEDSDCGHGYPVCPECGNGVPGPKWDAPAGLDMGHAPTCRLARLLKGGEGE